MAYHIVEVYRGDIFYIQMGSSAGSEQSAGRPGVIVSNDMGNKHSPNVEVVFLTSKDKKPLPTHVDVFCKVPSTALCENIQTISKERLGDFIKSCSTSEMKRIDEALMVSLGIETQNTALTCIEVERNLYKAMYEHLLERITPTTK